jgi:uncharacterized protein (DUF1501 family)
VLRVLGNPKRSCDGLSRRDLLVAGGLGLLGAARTASAAPQTKPKAKSVICLFLFGGWSQLETFDMKPDAPADIRGPYRPIASALPGYPVCEHLPQLARRMDKVAVVRSVQSDDSNHNTSLILTGRNATIGGTALKGINPGIPHDWPFFMSALHHAREQSGDIPQKAVLPAHVCVPNRLGLLEGYNRTGPYGGFLGAKFDPVCTRFGTTGELLFNPNGVKAETLKFAPPGVEPGPGVTLDQLSSRASLLDQFDAARGPLLASPATDGYDAARRQALAVLTSDRFRRALDVSAEPTKLRDAYGWNLFGQGVLLGRRLVEAGVPLVTAIWDCTKEGPDIATLGWDTHWDHFKACEGWLLPGLDRALASLLDDLEDRGLLDETLVVCVSEMGRTPKINGRSGRDHWVGSYCALFAGAGVKPGVVYGRSDKIAGSVTDGPVSPQDVLATVYHLCGVPADATIRDRLQRTLPLYGDGTPIRAVLA